MDLITVHSHKPPPPPSIPHNFPLPFSHEKKNNNTSVKHVKSKFCEKEIKIKSVEFEGRNRFNNGGTNLGKGREGKGKKRRFCIRVLLLSHDEVRERGKESHERSFLLFLFVETTVRE